MRTADAVHLFFTLSLGLISCARNPNGPSGSSTDALITALRGQGATVVRGSSLPRDSHPYFSVNGQELAVNNGNVTVFEYPTAAAADSDAARVAPSGSPIGTVQISWIEPPSFYRSGPLIVLYVGSDNAVLQPLERVLGRPFAHP
jgi:hypothetical protein